ncbi:hypothetical protein BHE74_00028834 [Ensete ventricosum]|nr:hypothetical protein BHE74_00028834 [Ensete ventricosum]RZS06990.1 hypothetical protein BHM03_00037748 [Ensete ventricosum]
MDEGAIDDFKDGLILKSTYQSASRSVHEPTATGRYCGFSLISSDTALYQAITVEISTVTAQYRSIMVDFNHLRPLSGDISLAAAGYDEGRRSKKKREKKGENLERCHPLTIRQQLDYQRQASTTSHLRWEKKTRLLLLTRGEEIEQYTLAYRSIPNTVLYQAKLGTPERLDDELRRASGIHRGGSKGKKRRRRGRRKEALLPPGRGSVGWVRRDP